MKKSDFIEFLLREGVLVFGDFTTKSGRKTPYFLNLGHIYRGSQLWTLASAYSDYIVEHYSERVNNLFGPAYKGIPLGTAIAACLYREHCVDMATSFNRKEIKDHGEGGNLLGNPYRDATSKWNTLIVEDVTTAGTSIRETMPLLKAKPTVHVVGLLVAVDRGEKGESGKSALAEVGENYGLETGALCNVWDIVELVKAKVDAGEWPSERLDAMYRYLEMYGAVK